MNHKVNKKNIFTLWKGAEKMEKLVYNIPEVAELLGISKSYAYQLVKERRIPVLDLGRRKVIPKVSLDEWLKSVAGTEINE